MICHMSKIMGSSQTHGMELTLIFCCIKAHFVFYSFYTVRKASFFITIIIPYIVVVFQYEESPSLVKVRDLLALFHVTSHHDLISSGPNGVAVTFWRNHCFLLL